MIEFIGMRHMIWIAALVALAQFPVAFARSNRCAKAGTYDAAPNGGPPPAFRADQPNPENRGTPDDPKPRGSAPRGAPNLSWA